MRTKSLVAVAALLAAGAASSMAQSVYSLNVVGYVNTVLPPDRVSFVANPLNNGNNMLSTVIPSIPAGGNMIAFQWNPNLAAGSGDFDVVASWADFTSSWDANFSIPPGKGFAMYNGATTNITITFVGEVAQGSLTNNILGGYLPNIIGSIPAIGGTLTNVTAGMVYEDGDIALTWDPNADAPNGNFTGLASYTLFPTPRWDTSASVPPNVDLDIPVGKSFMYLTANPKPYVRNFTVQ